MVAVAGSTLSKIVPTENEESKSDWSEMSSAEAIALILEAGAHRLHTHTGTIDELTQLNQSRPTKRHRGTSNGLVDYASHVDELRSPAEVLNELHAVTTRSLPLPVLGAVHIPIKFGDWDSVQLGKSAFLHDDVPAGWWEEYEAIARGKFRPALFLAGSSMASHTWTEVRRLMQPIGIDVWSYELGLKYGMRDGLTCPVGGRWVVGFWSRKDLLSVLTCELAIRCRERCGWSNSSISIPTGSDHVVN